MPSAQVFASLEGKGRSSPVPRGIGRAIAAELAAAGAASSSAIAPGRRRPRRRRGIGGRAIQADVSRPERGEAARRGGRRPRHPRQQRGPHPRRPARAHVRRRLADGARDEPLLRLLHLPRRDAADDAQAGRRDREHLLDRRRARQLGPDELRRLEGRDHRLHGRSPASSAPAMCARTSSRPAT